MNLFESFRVAWTMLMLHKLRALLTMLGVIIGVMSVTVIVMVSQGFRDFITNQFNTLSADSIFMFVDRSRLFRGQSTTIESLTDADRQYILDRARTVKVVSAIGGAPNQTARAGDRESKDTRVTPIDQYYEQIVNIDLLQGRLISGEDVETMANVAVISEGARDLLFPDGQALGETITMNGITLEVIGVIKNVDEGGPGGSNPRLIYLPLTTAQRKWIGGRDYQAFYMRPYPGISVQETMDDVWQVMMAKSNNKPIYRLDSSESILQVFQTILGGAQLALAGIAALSLLVGGIGIMNIMLVSVTERTREIGLRKAVGGKRGAILTQFLIEAGLLSLIGGIIGMSIAWVMGQAIAFGTKAAGLFDGAGLSAPFPLTAAIGAALFSALIGMVFGFFPAVQASRLDPIVALRHE